MLHAACIPASGSQRPRPAQGCDALPYTGESRDLRPLHSVAGSPNLSGEHNHFRDMLTINLECVAARMLQAYGGWLPCPARDCWRRRNPELRRWRDNIIEAQRSLAVNLTTAYANLTADTRGEHPQNLSPVPAPSGPAETDDAVAWAAQQRIDGSGSGRVATTEGREGVCRAS